MDKQADIVPILIKLYTFLQESFQNKKKDKKDTGKSINLLSYLFLYT